MPAPVRVALRVRPGASRTRVGGTYGEGADARLLVAVTERAVEGAATEAVLRAVARALGVRSAQVTLVTGRSSRDKVVEIVDPPDDLADRLIRLRAGAAP
jgi:uncharacterized protein YggU (UPF0235/DUF167 family)